MGDLGLALLDPAGQDVGNGVVGVEVPAEFLVDAGEEPGVGVVPCVLEVLEVLEFEGADPTVEFLGVCYVALDVFSSIGIVQAVVGLCVAEIAQHILGVISSHLRGKKVLEIKVVNQLLSVWLLL